jgi:sigma-B regulation protein RsbU (phosphoserine phosphatase)
VLELIGTLTKSRLRLWHATADQVSLVGGDDPGWQPGLPFVEGVGPTGGGDAWFTPVPDCEGLWLEIAGNGVVFTATPRAALAAPLLERLLSSERDATRLWEELTVRYSEIDLLYAISEILGHTVHLEEAAKTIIRQVSRVVGARRASIMVADDEAGLLRVVAAQGFDRVQAPPVGVDDPHSIAARVYREQRVIAGEIGGGRGRGRHPNYRGDAYLSVPICYAAPGTTACCIGVINLTDSIDGDRFTSRDRKLVTAVASQIGAAIENARLATREREQQRLEDELALAHDLQLKLMPDPAVLQGEAEVAVRCLPLASVGGDFYSFVRLGAGRIGIMVGDVSSHGFSAALVMALVLSAAGIHATGATDPAQTLRLLRESLVAKLSETEMFVTIFYGVLDRKGRVLNYANAGHHHAYRIPQHGPPERLEATAPPLGLGTGTSITSRRVVWTPGADVLALWTDGLVDAAAPDGNRFTEPRLLERLVALRGESPETIVATITAEVEEFAPTPEDDRTLLVLRI